MLPRNSNALVGLQGWSSLPCPACLLPSISDIRCGSMRCVSVQLSKRGVWRGPLKNSTEAKGLTSPFSSLAGWGWRSDIPAYCMADKKTPIVIHQVHATTKFPLFPLYLVTFISTVFQW